MATFPLSIITPGKVVFDTETEMVIVRTPQGDVAVLKGHVDYVAPIDVGAVKVKINGEFRTAAVSAGLLKVSSGGAVILVQTFEWAEDIDSARAAAAEKKARDRMESFPDKADINFIVAELKLKRALNRLKISGNK